ncbi:hypothetical protein [Thermus islandicus]|uniref:hypothetical protein n=1 Tax=Thermus islandicus TaxID=540988 RepID=UPI0003B57E3A|nr:hypothetical protein [Thermus islandicus]
MVSRSQGSVSWTGIYTLQSVSPAQATVRSYSSATVTATYTGPLPGTLCYDGSCRQAAPGYYAAPGDEVLATWTKTRTEDCPSDLKGTVTVTEYWRKLKTWSPSAGGLSSRGTLTFTSTTRDEMYDVQRERDCTPRDPSSTNDTKPNDTKEPNDTKKTTDSTDSSSN